MKILLAGGAGYIGTKLAAALIERGYEVTVMDDLWFGDFLPETIPVVKKDLFSCTQEDMEGFEQVVFLAGLSNDPMAEYSPSQNFIFNGALPPYLAFYAKKAGIRRFIYASSCSVYGYTVDQLYDETCPVTCEYPYGISKLQGERGVHQLQDDTFSVISLRQGTVSGHSDRMRFDLIINTMFKFAITEGRITVNNPSIWRPILNINDAINGYLRAIQVDYSISGVYNIATDNYTVGQVGDMVKMEVEKLSGRRINLQINNVQDFRNYKVTIDKIRTELGYSPQYTVRDIVQDLYEHLDSYGDLNQERYYNIQVFKRRNQTHPDHSVSIA